MDKIKELWKMESVQKIVISLVVVLVALVVWLIIKKIVHSYRKKKQALDKDNTPSTVSNIIYDVIKVVVFVLLIIVILQINGINVSSLVAGLSVVSAIIGVALQDFLKDIIMGVHIMMDSFYDVGDLVQFGGDEGIVESFNLRTTKIRSINTGDLQNICNRNIDKIVKSGVEVYITQPMPYDVSVGKTADLINRICAKAEQNEEIESCTFLGTSGLTDAYVNYLLKVIITVPEAKLRTRRAVLGAIQEEFKAEGISIPHEQMEVHMQAAE